MIWISVLVVLLVFPERTAAFAISSAAWSNSIWEDHCKDVRTSYNPDRSLAIDRLTLTLTDPRFSDFLYWIWANKFLNIKWSRSGGQNGMDQGMGSFSIGRRGLGGRPIPSPPLIMPSITLPMNTAGKTICSRTFLRGSGRLQASALKSGFRWRLPQLGHSFFSTWVGRKVHTIAMSSIRKAP